MLECLPCVYICVRVRALFLCCVDVRVCIPAYLCRLYMCARSILYCVHFQNRTLDNRTDSFSVETLLDALCVLYDECCSSSFKREKTVADFIETGGPGM